jgi:hypothetical protein
MVAAAAVSSLARHHCGWHGAIDGARRGESSARQPVMKNGALISILLCSRIRFIDLRIFDIFEHMARGPFVIYL